jgi:hypothetical protein
MKIVLASNPIQIIYAQKNHINYVCQWVNNPERVKCGKCLRGNVLFYISGVIHMISRCRVCKSKISLGLEYKK